MLYETAELLYAYVNQIPPAQLTASGPYCIPIQDVATILEKACGDLDPSASLLQKFFAPYNYSSDPNRSTCLAFSMLYTFIDLECLDLDLDQQTSRMASMWESMRRGPYSIRQISRYALDIAPLDEGPPTSLSKELKQLSLSEDFYDILLESFSDFSYQISALCSLIRPVAEKLTKLLEPYVARAMPLADSWEQLLQHNGVEALLQSRGATFLERPLSRAWFALRYFDCWQGNGQIRTETNELFMLLGVGLEPSLIPAPKKDELSEVEFAAFRLFGDKVRSKIIHALQDRPMYMQELTNYLDLNPGTVSRNLNSMAFTHLLEKEIRGDRYYYRTNTDYIRTVFRKMLEYYVGQDKL